jgi:hypothetical protein
MFSCIEIVHLTLVPRVPVYGTGELARSRRGHDVFRLKIHFNEVVLKCLGTGFIRGPLGKPRHFA